MGKNISPKPNSINAFTVILLANQGQYLLLKRAASKRFAPNLWTGIGGRVETSEYEDVRAAALRELDEESGIQIGDVENFSLRRVLLHNRPGGPLTLLFYFTAYLVERVHPACPEGRLDWIDPANLDRLEIIETTRPVIRLLIDDMERDPQGNQPAALGVAVYEPDGRFLGNSWAGR